ncbi:MAG: hypothetical protein H7X77_00770, partial [Anaerolineae bacterium]|nr:hypothetical protein [Anaerolineae bacterium]
HIQVAKKAPRRGWFGRRRQSTKVPVPDLMDDDDLVLETADQDELKALRDASLS